MEKLLRTLVFILLIVIVCPIEAKMVVREGSSYDWNVVMDAIIQVESGGRADAKSGKSVGAMQITPILVKECNNILRKRKSKKRYTLSDRLCVKKSKEMFLLFQSEHNPKNNIEQAIRSWNGGINYSIRHTQRYYNKVMSFIK